VAFPFVKHGSLSQKPVELRPSIRTPRFYGRIGALLVLAASIAVGVRWLPVNPYSASELARVENVTATALWPLASQLGAFDPGKHKVFPYSVIPGGAHSSQELQKAVASDPVVARHYSDFDLQRVHPITLGAPQLMYVSYRIGSNVFWTKRKLALLKGETMLTDGHTMARTRCGNRVSAEPVRPQSAEEPAIEDFAAPELSPAISTPYLAAFSAPPTVPAEGTQSPYTPVVPFLPLPGGGSAGLTTSIPPPGGGGGGGGGGNPPPVGTPEPGTVSLLLLALSSAVLLRRRAKAC
jgi:hypothetical protein